MTASPAHADGELVSVVIVNYNGGDMLDRCLRSVFAQPYRPLDVLVVDNASTDGSLEGLRERFPDVRVLRESKNLGFAGGNVVGVDSAVGDWVVLLNNDTEVEPEWIPALLDAGRGQRVGAVTSRVVTEGVPARYYEMNGSVNFLGYNIMRVFQDLSQVFFAGGASLMFRRALVGPPFLPEYFLYHEDVYLSWRLRLEGYEIRMAQKSVVRHRGSATTQRQPSAEVSYYQERNRLLNCLLFYEARTLLLLLPYFLIDGAAKLTLSVLGKGKSLSGVVRAYAWFALHGGWILRERRRHQARRRCPDREVMRWMSSKVLDSESAVARVANRCSRWYARTVGLAAYD